MSEPKIGLVIVAAGRGQRAGGVDGPKQYRILGGKAVIARTLNAFQTKIDPSNIVVVMHRDDHALLADALGGDTIDAITVCTGGETRQESVFAGLKALINKDPMTHVMVHDAARPFVSTHLLEMIIDQIRQTPEKGVLPALAVAETVKQVDDGANVERTIPRDMLYTAQTPQAAPLQTLLDAHTAAQAAGVSVTDDSALLEWAKHDVIVVSGDPDNVKLTYPKDFEMAERKLQDSAGSLPDVRTGNGYDVHRFGPGDTVWLCGVGIPHTQTLSGHSDADVGLHALTDALLATCGAGDIGDHFPPSDPQWKGAASSIFIAHAADIVRNHGGTIMNADISIIAEQPKIAPHRTAMQEKMAELLGIETFRCSVKATTNEEMGFVGRGEGIAAIATATVVYGGKP